MDLKKEIIDDIEKAQLSAEEILRKYDKESDKRELTGIWNTIINAICIVFCIFQVYTAAFGILDAQLQRAIHLAFGFALVFLLYPMRQSWSRKEMNWIDVGFGRCWRCCFDVHSCVLPRFGTTCRYEQRNGLYYSANWHAACN